MFIGSRQQDQATPDCSQNRLAGAQSSLFDSAWVLGATPVVQQQLIGFKFRQKQGR
jgi:hypothetical protein